MDKQNIDSWLFQQAIRRARNGIRFREPVTVYKCSMCGYQYHTFPGEPSLDGDACDCYLLNDKFKGSHVTGVIHKIGEYNEYGDIADLVATKILEFTKRLYLEDGDVVVNLEHIDEL